MARYLKIGTPTVIMTLFILIFMGTLARAEGEIPKPRGEIRVVESWRPDVTVLGHINVFRKTICERGQHI